MVELAAMGGMLISAINRSGLGELGGTAYQFDSGAGAFIGTCGDTLTFPGTGDCDAGLATELGGLVGGSLFAGISLAPEVHVGGRFGGGVRFPDGYWLAGGPSASFRAVGPLWLGASVLLGTEQHIATVDSARGSVPEAQQAINGGEFVDIPLEDLGFTEGEVQSGFLIGGGLEISLALAGPSPHALAPTGRTGALLDGSIMLSLQPSIMVAGNGLIVNVPASIGYRFH